jgi:hypothetical protein
VGPEQVVGFFSGGVYLQAREGWEGKGLESIKFSIYFRESNFCTLEEQSEIEGSQK